MRIMRSVTIPVLVLLGIISVLSCKNSESGPSSDDYGSEEKTGYVTFYDGADSPDVAYYVPELEAGWYHCAVSEEKLNDIPPGSAVELTANGKTVHLLVTDLCPNSTNYHHTKNTNYYFDLEESAFAILADKSVGVLNMTFRVIPYPTEKVVGFISTATEEWYLQGRFYNMRYPLAKVEYSLDDGKSFEDMEKVSKDNNLYYIDGIRVSGKIIFRLTDINGDRITSGAVSKPGTGCKVALGVNF